jgi:tRNA dimethylallyltransferase
MGANASGKTALAIELAKKTDGEIISADSKQIYKHLAAGTSKPAGRRKTILGKEVYLVDGIPYHLVDFADPRTAYDAGNFAADAKALMDSISAKGRTPIIVGGTGMYIQALWNGLDRTRNCANTWPLSPMNKAGKRCTPSWPPWIRKPRPRSRRTISSA